MSFCTVINCIDGRIQIPVNSYLKNRFKAEYVDTITEPAPNLIFAQQTNFDVLESIYNRVNISIEYHKSSQIAIVGHHDCVRNSAPKEKQIEQLRVAVRYLQIKFSKAEVIGLWVNENWEVSEIA